MANNNRQKVHFLVKASLLEAIPTEAPSQEVEEEAREREYVEEQPDLICLESVFVSTGMNNNDDVFMPGELLRARSTAKHKPVNVDHNDSRIIGHISSSYVETKNGERISEHVIRNNPYEVPPDFDIAGGSVVYAYVFQDEARKIRERAANDSLFVSVEAWYSDYDYLVGNRVVERNPSTMAFLESALRFNGGDGLIEGQRVGRVLRNLVIAGIGIMIASKPANPDSVVRSVSAEIDEPAWSDELKELFEKNTMGFMSVVMASTKQAIDQEQIQRTEAANAETAGEAIDGADGLEQQHADQKAEESQVGAEEPEQHLVDSEVTEQQETDVKKNHKEELAEARARVDELEKLIATEEGDGSEETKNPAPEGSDSPADGKTQTTEPENVEEQAAHDAEDSEPEASPAKELQPDPEPEPDPDPEPAPEPEPDPEPEQKPTPKPKAQQPKQTTEPEEDAQGDSADESASDDSTNDGDAVSEPPNNGESDGDEGQYEDDLLDITTEYEQALLGLEDSGHTIETAVEDAIDQAKKEEDPVAFTSEDDGEDSLFKQFIEVFDEIDIGFVGTEKEE